MLVVEDDERQRARRAHLLTNDDVGSWGGTAAEALAHLRGSTFDCMVMDLEPARPERLRTAAADDRAGRRLLPPVIVYTGRALSRDEEQQLRRFSKSIIIRTPAPRAAAG